MTEAATATQLADRGGRATVYLVTMFTWSVMIALSGAAVFGFALITGDDPETATDPARIEALMAQPPLLLLSVAVSSGTMAAAAVLGSVLRPERARLGSSMRARLGLFGVAPLDVLMVVLGTLGLGAALDAGVFLLGLRDTGSLGVLHSALGSLEGPALWAAALAIGLAPGFGEELFFRGFVLRRLLLYDRPAVAILVSSIAFGLFHFDPVHSPAAAGLGVYLGLAVWMTGSVWAGIAAHAVNNAIATLLAGVELGAAEHGLLLGTGTISALFAMRFVARRARARGSTFAAPFG